MKKYTPFLFLMILFSGLIITNSTFAQDLFKLDSTHQYFYIKKEIDKGLFSNGQNERESLISDNLDYSEKLYTGYAGFQLKGQVWNFLQDKQEMMNLSVNVGPFLGSGTGFEINPTEIIKANKQRYGLRAGIEGNYESRFYYDQKTYTLVQVNAWGRNDVFWQNSVGNRVDTNQVMTDYNNDEFLDHFRYGFQAKGGWGFGRLKPMNHYMVSDYIFSKFYPQRLFSEIEKGNLANLIGAIKQRREPGVERESAEELRELKEFLRKNMLLEPPNFSENEWLMGEFLPRYDGSRLELGPFFNYYNREPDFYYGGFLQYRNDKYQNFRWNRNISLQASYSHYKKNDWASIVADFGYSYYPNLKTQFSFGLKYMPGIVIYSLQNMEPVKHNFIPYIEYFTQVNEKSRVNLTFAWHIADGEEFLMPGPEFTLSLYRSSY